MTTSILEWKPEPASPLGYAEEDDWFLVEAEGKHNDLEDDNFCSLTRKEIAQQLLEDIDSFVKQENEDTFSQWFEDKIDLPMFDEIEPVLPAEGLKPGIEELKDLDEALNAANLTPPHSPENAETASYIILDFVGGSRQQYSNDALTDSSFVGDESQAEMPGEYDLEEVFPAEDAPDYLTAPPTPVPDLEKEMAVVDEVVRSTAQRLENGTWESDASSSRSSSSESFGSPGSVAFEEESDDPEWVPLPKKTIGKAGRQSRRTKPYGRECTSQEDRWLRKKEQNKNAATRYRQKKKAELSEIIEEEKKLEEQKVKLEERFADIQMEIKYIKGLMRDLFKAKGLLIN